MQNGKLFNVRRAGILLHPTSLPHSIGNGDLGEQAFYFIDFLVSCGVSVWQMLPLSPPHDDLSPYQSQSVNAINPVLISLDKLIEHQWLTVDRHPPHDHDEATIRAYRFAQLRKAYTGFLQTADEEEVQAFEQFKINHADWLEDYALYRLLKSLHDNASWTRWPAKYRDRKKAAIDALKQQHADEVTFYCFEQFVAFGQWLDLKKYSNEKGVYLFGDMPIFVAHDSVDVWASRKNFLLDKKGQPNLVAGVPPDYFSATGQLWGNPHYDWNYMRKNGFQWWLDRFKTQQMLFDVIRIDHFRGFEACWAVPADEKTAINGEWVKVPGAELFETLRQHIDLPLVAEDLGVITDEVTALREQFGLPGMKILQFAFDGGSSNPYLPHYHEPNSVVYTGTHDNNTTVGWFHELPPHEKQHVCSYVQCDPHDMPWALISSAFASVARLAIIPMQDVLSADASQRMNIPGTADGNWRWRFDWNQLPPGVHDRVKQLVNFYDRV
ncbi:4-alpha-glucanotransferase [Candidatus Albibeggiatoa sp. nov. BB20]|uniref:4-alpha-glucanotransferase n=1 Tax=Candidatus Albibeggiatoa sp. nov. BB20 TaxID=3162723 RepID=UPI00336562E1